MTDTNALQPAAQTSLDLAETGNIPQLEDAWLELMEDPPLSGEFYDNFFRAMRRAHELDKAHDLIVVAATEIANRENWSALHEIIEVVGRRWPDSKPLRPFASKAMKGVYAGVAELPHILATCRGVALDCVFDHVRSYLAMLPGQAYSHTYWGQGVVHELDIPGGRITLDFPNERKTIAIDFLRKHLTHLPDGSFLSMRTKDADRLAEIAEDDPVAVVKLALEGGGGRMKQSQLKTLLLEGVIDESHWTSWWARARKALQIDPLVDFDTRGGAHAEVGLREKPKTLEEEVAELFFGPDADISRRVAAVQHLADTQRATGAQLDGQALHRMAIALSMEWKQAASEPLATRLQYAFAAEDLSQLAGSDHLAPTIPSSASLLAEADDYTLLAQVEPPEYGVRALQAMIARDGDQGIAEAALVLHRTAPRVAQAIWKELDAEHHAQTAVRAIRTLFENALENPETYLWAARNIAERKWMQLDDYLPASSFVYDLVDNVDRWHQILERGNEERPVLHAARLLLSKVRAMLSARNFEIVCAAVEELSLDQAQDLRRAIQYSNAFTDNARDVADRQMVLTRKDLEAAIAIETLASPDAAILYCTRLGHNRAVRELHELNTVKIPQNALEIEKARAEGDLKENAGYHGARDKHVLLMQQAHELGHNISRARVVEGANVTSKSVGFGSGFNATNVDTGVQEYYVVLGRWESDPERRVFSYQAPFIIQFLSKQIGDTVTVEYNDGKTATFRIDSIENALKDSEFDREL